MTVAWKAQRERGNRTTIRMMVWIAGTLGRPIARLLLYPICAYYLVTSRRANQALHAFYRRLEGRPAGWARLFRHYYCFAATILDRVFFLQGRFDLFRITLHGFEELDRLLAKGQGCLLLGSHLGSFEVVRAIGLSRRNLEVRVLMDEENAPLIRELIQELNPAVAGTVIQIGGPDTMLRVQEFLHRGGCVGLMGDRVTSDEQSVLCTFLGGPATVPSGSIRLAHVTRAPVVLFFGLYRGQNRYDVHLEVLSERVQLSQDREADLRRWTQQYVNRLEHYCREAADNWFNFYDFWTTAP